MTGCPIDKPAPSASNHGTMSKSRRRLPGSLSSPNDDLVEISAFGANAKLSGGGLSVVVLALIIALFAILALIIALVK